MLPGVNELILTAVIILLLFGAAKVPKAVKYTGKTIYEYKKGQREGEEGLKQIEQRIKEIEKQEAKENAVERIKKDKLDLDYWMSKEPALLVLGLLLIASGMFLMVNGTILGKPTIVVAVILGALGITTIAIAIAISITVRRRA
ncbi:MAG: Sec-independent protein translocase subunit TatA/TatB [Halobacteriota archaeon]